MFKQFSKNTKGAPVVEYTVLLGLIGALTVGVVFQLGGSVAAGFSSTDETVHEFIWAADEVAPPTASRATPPAVPVFPPDGESGGRYFESFMLVYQDAADLAVNNASSMPPANRPPFVGFLPYHEAAAFGFVPGQAVTTAEMSAYTAWASTPSASINTIFAANNVAYTQCVQSNPDEFYGDFWGHTWEDVELTNRITGPVSGSDIGSATFDQPQQYNTQDAIFGDDVDVSWNETPKPFEALWAYTCSRPIP